MLSKNEKMILDLGFYCRLPMGIEYCTDKGMTNNNKVILGDICTMLYQGYDYDLTSKAIGNRLHISSKTARKGEKYLQNNGWIKRSKHTGYYHRSHPITYIETTDVNVYKILLNNIEAFIKLDLVKSLKALINQIINKYHLVKNQNTSTRNGKFFHLIRIFVRHDLVFFRSKKKKVLR